MDWVSIPKNEPHRSNCRVFGDFRRCVSEVFNYVHETHTNTRLASGAMPEAEIGLTASPATKHWSATQTLLSLFASLDREVP